MEEGQDLRSNLVGFENITIVWAHFKLRYHKYYQWVCFTLFFQAILFYIPRFLWKMWEGGKLKMLVSGLNVPIVDEETRKDRKTVLVNYFTENRQNHNFYAFRFFACEFLNLVNVLFQIYFMDFFLDGEFTTYGSEVLAMTEMENDQRTDPMARVFPKITKCTFHKFGASGSVQKFDGICVLPLNIINEKIYVFLWFWFVLLAVSFSQMISNTPLKLARPGDHKASDDISSQCSCLAMSSRNTT